VLLVGDESRRGLDQEALVALAERLRAPVLATYKGKGGFPETHPLSAGIVTGAEIERPLLEEADLLLAVGLDPIELLARPWTYEAGVVALREGTPEDPYLQPRVTLTGPMGDSLSRLSEALGDPMSQWQPGDAAARAAEMRDPLRVAAAGMTSWAVVEAVQEVIGDARVTVDAGAHMFPVTWFWRSTRPNRFHISNGLATMGHAVPAAIGAALAAPGDTVVAFTGDGGFTINAAELETALRAGVKVIVVVVNDASLTLIRVKQDETGLERANVDFAPSDFAQVAAGFGVTGLRAETEGQLRTALAAAVAGDQTAVIDVAVSGEDYGEIHRLIRKGR
jgi:acetolactate synthase-1/2/3 large subunit